MNYKTVFLIGENGQGKTNLLEAIYLLCYGSSFRTKQDELMIGNDFPEASVNGVFENEDKISRKIMLILKRKRGKEIYVEEKKVKNRREIMLSIPCVIFAHSDFDFIKGEPYKKRTFINQTICLYESEHLRLLQRYKKIVKERNEVLRQKKKDLLEIYNFELAQTGLKIQEKRTFLVEKFNTIFNQLFQEISGLPEKIAISYYPSWFNCETVDQILRFLSARQEKDLALQITTNGPHRDNFYFFYGKVDFSKIASTGQLRLLSIILRTAQATFFSESSGKKPILLIDDVLLELDKNKRERCLKNLPSYEQAFFTFLPDEQIKNLNYFGRVNKMKIVNGSIEKWNELEIF